MGSKKILIIDDTAFMRTILKNLLRNLQDTEIYEGNSGLEAIKLYKAYRPDLVIMDLIMPVMDGITALQEIKRYDSGAKVVMISSKSSRKNVAEAVESGAVGYIVKPFSRKYVIDTVAAFLMPTP